MWKPVERRCTTRTCGRPRQAVDASGAGRHFCQPQAKRAHRRGPAHRQRGYLLGLSLFIARIMPILANMVGPPRSATRSSASIAACHSGASCSRFGSFVMKVAASRRVTSWRPSGSGIGSPTAQFSRTNLGLNPFGGCGGASSPSRSLRSRTSAMLDRCRATWKIDPLTTRGIAPLATRSEWGFYAATQFRCSAVQGSAEGGHAGAGRGFGDTPAQRAGVG
jgi:hypothetical protein